MMVITMEEEGRRGMEQKVKVRTMSEDPIINLQRKAAARQDGGEPQRAIKPSSMFTDARRAS